MPDRSDPKHSRQGSAPAGDGALARIMEDARKFAADEIVDETLRSRFLIVVEEIVLNILLHGRADPESPISWRFSDREGIAEMQFEDSGIAFDPAKHAAIEPETALSIEDAREGGQGLPIIRAWCRITSYRRTGGRNCVTLELKPE